MYMYSLSQSWATAGLGQGSKVRCQEVTGVIFLMFIIEHQNQPMA